MTFHPALKMALLSTFLLFSVAPNARPQTATPPHIVNNLAAISWLAGHWAGTAGKNSTEKICTQPTHAVMTCTFLVSNANQMLFIELWSIHNQSDGLVAQVRFFKPDLQLFDPPAATYRARIAAPDKIIFENAGASGPKSLTITRLGRNKQLSRVEDVGKDGKSAFFENSMHRVP